MINLNIDFDGVIMDTITSSYKMLEDLGINPKNTEQVIKFYEELDWVEFLKNTKEINNSFENIHKIVDSRLFDVNILTHVSSLKEAEAKINYIRRKVRDITIITVPKRIDKTKVINAKDAILIDDYTGNLRKWEEQGGIGVRFSLKLNGKGFHAIDHLDQIIEFVQQA